MYKLTPESTDKLQRILSKRLGRTLSKDELEVAYDRLMDFAYKLGYLCAPQGQDTSGSESN